MKTYILSTALSLLSLASSAQRPVGVAQDWNLNAQSLQTMNILRGAQNAESVIVDINGEQVRGVPFLIPQWLHGQIDMEDGNVYKQYEIAYNALDQSLLFLKNETPMEVSGTIRSFSFTYEGKTRSFINARSYKRTTSPMFFEIMYNCGKGQLLRSSQKNITRSFEKVGTIKEFQTVENYYFYNIADNKLINLKSGTAADIMTGLKLSQALADNIKLSSYEFLNDESRVNFFTAYCSQ